MSGSVNSHRKFSKEIEDLIQYENENTRLDFKTEEYRKENFASLIKDVLSMANAKSHEDRYIIIGLKPKSSSDRGILGLKEQITDSAIYQQLIFENIEPELSIDYFPIDFKNVTFSVLKISSCNNPPYLMKKDFGNNKNKLRRGDGFIRKGTHQTKLTRSDYDRFIEEKLNLKYFLDEVEFTLISELGENQIYYVNQEKIERPSQIKKNRIEKILEDKKERERRSKESGIPNLDLFRLPKPIGLGFSNSYEERDIKTLEENLKNVEETYYDHDCYECFERQANKYNIRIKNLGHNHIDDAFIIVKIPKIKGLYVSNKIYTNPEFDDQINPRGYDSLNYPTVLEKDMFFFIEESVGSIRHQIEQNAFNVDFRIFANTDVTNDKISIEIQLFGKNIKTSIKHNISVKTKLLNN